tara:strand:- start:162 stop:323 length:162 start_codon:yes stop_codon:yes gene_type:complete
MEQWFKETGAQYAVMTTKHHAGVALWDTALSDLNTVGKLVRRKKTWLNLIVKR